MKLYDTGDKKIKEIPPCILKPEITFYACGPTVYDNTHIGHMRRYVMDDVLKKALVFLGYKVRHVMNITDVGHLTGDNDSGEDKLEKGAISKGKTVWEVASEYEDQFWTTLKALNIQKKEIKVLHATKSIHLMIELIKKLEERGHVYETPEAIYFDTSTFKDYGKLSGQSLKDKQRGVREEVYTDPLKKNPADFALWFKRVGRFKDHIMHWESPWGDGFPGWHIECSAMAISGLNSETIDIHTGGIDHIPVHHENEIAQSECATGKHFVNFWVHHAFLQVNGEKMSKSKNNFFTLKDIAKHNINPLSLRLFFMQAHYRKPENFTWEAVEGANKAYDELVEIYNNLKSNNMIKTVKDLSGGAIFYLNIFREKIADDLNTASALANMWHMLKNTDISDTEKKFLLDEFDKVLGFNLSEQIIKKDPIPEKIKRLADKRLEARQKQDFEKSDKLRLEIEDLGYILKDIQNGYEIKKK